MRALAAFIQVLQGLFDIAFFVDQSLRYFQAQVLHQSLVVAER
jgi:hypothetical protein